MKTMIVATLTAGLVAAPMAMASGTIDDSTRALQIGSDHGISHFQSIELDNDDDNYLEIEGWVDEQWFVELDVRRDGTIRKEERRKRMDGPWGMTVEDATRYIEASAREGMTRVEELKIDASGHVEVEGDDDQGELEVNFRSGDSANATVERDS